MSSTTNSRPIFCAISGAKLGSLTTSNLAARIKPAHPVFSVPFHQLQKLAGKWRSLSFEDQNALALALILHPSSTGPLVTINCKFQFPEKELAYYLPSILHISKTFASLTPVQWRRITGKDNSDSKAIYRLPRFSISSSTTPKELLAYYLTILPTHLSLEGITSIDPDCLSQDTKEKLSSEIGAELQKIRAAREQKESAILYSKFKQNFRYWSFILEDIAEEFYLPPQWVEETAKQLQNTTDIRYLTALEKYLLGITQTIQHNNRLTLTAMQYTFALQHVRELKEQHSTGLLEWREVADSIKFVNPNPPTQNIVEVTELPRLQTPVQTMNPLLAKFQAMGQQAAKQEAAQVAKDSELSHFVLNYVSKVKESGEKPTLSDLDILATKDFIIPESPSK